MSALFAPATPRRIKATHRRRGKVASGRFVQRYYDPEIIRFPVPDPVGPEEDFIKHFNRYNYAMNNPVSNIDPNGMLPCELKENKQACLDKIEVKGDRSKVLADAENSVNAVDNFMSSIGFFLPKNEQKWVQYKYDLAITRLGNTSRKQVVKARKILRYARRLSALSTAYNGGKAINAALDGDENTAVSSGVDTLYGAIGFTHFGAPGALTYGITSTLLEESESAYETIITNPTDYWCGVFGGCP